LQACSCKNDDIMSVGPKRATDPRQGKCALCLQDRELRNSHILPKWCYARSFNVKHQLKVVGTPDLVGKTMQDGYKEPLLCDDCEGRFSRWETYAAPCFSDPPEPDLDVEYAYGISSWTPSSVA